MKKDMTLTSWWLRGYDRIHYAIIGAITIIIAMRGVK